MNIIEELAKYKNIIDLELEKTIPNSDLMQKKIFEAMRYSIFAGGKRLRPILTLKTCEMISGSYEEVMKIALGVEMIHTYSLIHDDLPAIDNDDFRRGKPTNHKVFGEDIAILAGDGLLNLAYETMLDGIPLYENNYERYILAIKEISKSAGVFGMIGGQTVDIQLKDHIAEKKKLDFIHKNKTSALIEASIVSGALVAGANQEQIKHLKTYGQAIGLCFQIRDDVLDKIGDEKLLGKKIGSDETNHKLTYLSLYGIDKSISEIQRLNIKAIEALSIFNEKESLFFIELANHLAYRKC
ncbi:geranyltranstransferase [Proteiniborus sp. DW1]|uniref:polyprenyl synthetase family protein n=1 Tax=Proteiniborus sp. DW1 TaxID=1889883 RepID=UPI00092E038B|nr:farnesyl diphosphate synthase [Proteiniborus sp. DW1]SCG83316.1 geranyltranstransferase [Proteiniborus sp. DW1]